MAGDVGGDLTDGGVDGEAKRGASGWVGLVSEGVFELRAGFLE